jgi:hypothetical protein
MPLASRPSWRNRSTASGDEGKLRRDQLDRHAPARRLFLGLIDRSHASGPDRARMAFCGLRAESALRLGREYGPFGEDGHVVLCVRWGTVERNRTQLSRRQEPSRQGKLL